VLLLSFSAIQTSESDGVIDAPMKGERPADKYYQAIFGRGLPCGGRVGFADEIKDDRSKDRK
jgi:hypothetical protein